MKHTKVQVQVIQKLIEHYGKPKRVFDRKLTIPNEYLHVMWWSDGTRMEVWPQAQSWGKFGHAIQLDLVEWYEGHCDDVSLAELCEELGYEVKTIATALKHLKKMQRIDLEFDAIMSERT